MIWGNIPDYRTVLVKREMLRKRYFACRKFSQFYNKIVNDSSDCYHKVRQIYSLLNETIPNIWGFKILCWNGSLFGFLYKLCIF